MDQLQLLLFTLKLQHQQLELELELELELGLEQQQCHRSGMLWVVGPIAIRSVREQVCVQAECAWKPCDRCCQAGTPLAGSHTISLHMHATPVLGGG